MKLVTRVLVGALAAGLAWVGLPDQTYGDSVSASPAVPAVLMHDDDDAVAVEAAAAPDAEPAQSDVADLFQGTTCYASDVGGYVACI